MVTDIDDLFFSRSPLGALLDWRGKVPVGHQAAAQLHLLQSSQQMQGLCCKNVVKNIHHPAISNVMADFKWSLGPLLLGASDKVGSMIRAFKLIVTLIFSVILTPLWAMEDGATKPHPFGLSFGMGEQAVGEITGRLEGAGDEGIFIAQPGFTGIETAEFVALKFNEEGELYDIVVVSHAPPNDPRGDQIKKEVGQLAGVLSEKYGEPRAINEIALGFEKEHYSLGFVTGKSKFAFGWHPPEVTITLFITTGGGRDLKWLLSYTDNKRRKALEAKSQTKLRDAL